MFEDHHYTNELCITIVRGKVHVINMNSHFLVCDSNSCRFVSLNFSWQMLYVKAVTVLSLVEASSQTTPEPRPWQLLNWG